MGCGLLPPIKLRLWTVRIQSGCYWARNVPENRVIHFFWKEVKLCVASPNNMLWLRLPRRRMPGTFWVGGDAVSMPGTIAGDDFVAWMNSDFGGANWADGCVCNMGSDVANPKGIDSKLCSVAIAEGFPQRFCKQDKANHPRLPGNGKRSLALQ